MLLQTNPQCIVMDGQMLDMLQGEVSEAAGFLVRAPAPATAFNVKFQSVCHCNRLIAHVCCFGVCHAGPVVRCWVC